MRRCAPSRNPNLVPMAASVPAPSKPVKGLSIPGTELALAQMTSGVSTLVHAKTPPRGDTGVTTRRGVERDLTLAAESSWFELRPRDLPAQDLELVPKHQQLDVFHVKAATTSN